MKIKLRGKTYWTTFTVHGIAHRKSLRTKNKHIAKSQALELIQAATNGTIEVQQKVPKKFFAAADAYLEHRRLRWKRARTGELEQELLSVTRAYFGDIPLQAITASAIAQFQKLRKEPPSSTNLAGMDAGIFKSPFTGNEIKSRASNRTINMNVSALARVLKFAGRWQGVEKQVEMLPTSDIEIGIALDPTEERRLLCAAASNPEWKHIEAAVVVALNTSMRRGEIEHLRRRDVDLAEKLIHVRRSKTAKGHRSIPLNTAALAAVKRMLDRLDKIGATLPDHYLWFACQWEKFDPTKPMSRWEPRSQ